jgi:hypothetical protein
MEQIIAQLRSDQIVAVLIGVAGLSFVGVALLGSLNIWGVQINLKGIPRILGGLLGLVLLVPAVAVAFDKQADPDTEVKTKASGCVLPLQPVSRGEPLKVGNQWLFLGATTVGANPQFGNFYIVGGTRRVPQQFKYTANIAKEFAVGGHKFFFKATEVQGEWARVQIVEDQAICP